MRRVLGREWKAECGLLSSWMEIDSCWGCSCGSVHVFSSCGSLPRFLIHASTLFDPPRLLSSLSLSSLIPPFSSTRFLQNQSLKHYTLCIRVRENGSEKSIHVRITWFDPIVEKGKKKRKIVLNLLSQNSNEIPKKKKKKRTFNSYIIQRERIKESHVRLFKIHAKFERRGKKKKKSRGEDGIRMPDKDCSRRGKHEGEDQRKDLDCPRKKKKKKKSQAIKKKKKETHPLTIDPSIPPRTRPREYLSLSLCLEGKKKERKKGG